MSPPKAKPVFTAWIDVENGVAMARVRMDAGQYSFRAGKQIVGDDFPQCVACLIEAIRGYARRKGWIE